MYYCPTYSTCGSPISSEAGTNDLGYTVSVSAITGATWVMGTDPDGSGTYGALYCGYCTTTSCKWNSQGYTHESGQYYTGLGFASAPGYGYSIAVSTDPVYLFPMMCSYSGSAVSIATATPGPTAGPVTCTFAYLVW